MHMFDTGDLVQVRKGSFCGDSDFEDEGSDAIGFNNAMGGDLGHVLETQAAQFENGEWMLLVFFERIGLTTLVDPDDIILLGPANTGAFPPLASVKQ
ncbi:MAG: hypothetical protein NVS3B25_09700 [Hymenobacter sp.]